MIDHLWNITAWSRGFNCGASLLEPQFAVQRRSHIDHVYGLQELVPRRRSAKCHSSRGIFPDRDDHAGNVSGRGATLKRFLDARLLRGRTRSERAIHGHDDHILPVASQMCHLKGGHRIHLFWRRFSHEDGGFHQCSRFAMSILYHPTVGFLSRGRELLPPPRTVLAFLQ